MKFQERDFPGGFLSIIYLIRNVLMSSCSQSRTRRLVSQRVQFNPRARESDIYIVLSSFLSFADELSASFFAKTFCIIMLCAVASCNVRQLGDNARIGPRRSIDRLRDRVGKIKTRTRWQALLRVKNLKQR